MAKEKTSKNCDMRRKAVAESELFLCVEATPLFASSFRLSCQKICSRGISVLSPRKIASLLIEGPLDSLVGKTVEVHLTRMTPDLKCYTITKRKEKKSTIKLVIA